MPPPPHHTADRAVLESLPSHTEEGSPNIRRYDVVTNRHLTVCRILLDRRRNFEMSRKSDGHLGSWQTRALPRAQRGLFGVRDGWFALVRGEPNIW